MSRSCVCGGSNENCRYCGGLGTIPDTLASALLAHVGRPESENIPAGSPQPKPKWMSLRSFAKPIPCPEGCGAILNSFTLKRHLKKRHSVTRHITKAHSGGLAAPQQANVTRQGPVLNATEPRFETCPVCQIQLRAGRLAKHMDKAHNVAIHAAIREGQNIARASVAIAESQKQATARQPGLPKVDASHSVSQRLQTPLNSPADARTSRRTYGVCPLCKVKVRVDRMRRHTAKVHNSRTFRFRGRQVQSSKDPLRDTTSLIAPRDNNLDATKLYAHPYREQGRYGSHPSHDGFDDESGPE